MAIIIFYKFTTTKGFIYPLVFIENNSLFTAIYLSLETNQKPFMLLWIKYSFIFGEKNYKLCDEIIDFIDIKMLEEIRPHQCPFFHIIMFEMGN